MWRNGISFFPESVKAVSTKKVAAASQWGSGRPRTRGCECTQQERGRERASDLAAPDWPSEKSVQYVLVSSVSARATSVVFVGTRA